MLRLLILLIGVWTIAELYYYSGFIGERGVVHGYQEAFAAAPAPTIPQLVQ